MIPRRSPAMTTRCCMFRRTPRYRLRLFFFNAPPTTAIYTLSLHDALPISEALKKLGIHMKPIACGGKKDLWIQEREQWHSGANFLAFEPGKIVGYERNVNTLEELNNDRSEEHTSELQSRPHLVCRLLLEKK